MNDLSTSKTKSAGIKDQKIQLTRLEGRSTSFLALRTQEAEARARDSRTKVRRIVKGRQVRSSVN